MDLHIPDEFTVDGEKVRVRRKQKPKNRGVFSLGGEYDPGPPPTIYLARGLTRRQEVGMLFHEVLHHLVERSGLKLTATQEETVVSSLDAWLLQFLADNAWFTEAVGELMETDDASE